MPRYFFNNKTGTLAAGGNPLAARVFRLYEQIKESLPEGIQNLNMHDCEITDANFYGNDFVMNIDSDGGYVKISKLVLNNAPITQHIENLVGAIWLYNEVYQVDEKYELHMLLLTKNWGRLEEMTVLIDNVEYIT